MWADNMADKSCPSYLYQKRSVYSFSKQVPCDVRQYYKRDRVVVCLKTRSVSRAKRMCDSIRQRLHDSFIMHYAYGELGLLAEEMRRSFHGHFKKDINVKSEIGVMLPSSFDGKEWSDLTFEEQIHGPPESSQWEERSS